MTRILLATSTPDLENLVKRTALGDASVELIGVARSGKDAVKMAGKLLPDIVAVELRDDGTAETVKEIMAFDEATITRPP